jgi:3-dehydroquinate dehydratase-2
MSSILVLNGPNLNMLGVREPAHYGSQTLEQITKNLIAKGKEKKLTVTAFQSNSEEALITRIHEAHSEKVTFIIINPAAFTHTSVAIRDAILAVNIPFIEVHLSNIYQREEFRHHSYFSDVPIGVISGLGSIGYQLALDAADQWLKNK